MANDDRDALLRELVEDEDAGVVMMPRLQARMCLYCGWESSLHGLAPSHLPECPVARARKLLGYA